MSQLYKSMQGLQSVVYLFVWVFSPLWRIFHSFGDVTFTDEGLQILSEGFFKYATPTVTRANPS